MVLLRRKQQKTHMSWVLTGEYEFVGWLIGRKCFLVKNNSKGSFVKCGMIKQHE